MTIKRGASERGDCDRTEACHKLKLLVTILKADKRKGSNRGFCWIRDYPELGLEIGDRLEPALALRYVCDFFANTRSPLKVVSWKCSSEAMARHRTTLFDATLGTLPGRWVWF